MEELNKVNYQLIGTDEESSDDFRPMNTSSYKDGSSRTKNTLVESYSSQNFRYTKYRWIALFCL